MMIRIFLLILISQMFYCKHFPFRQPGRIETVSVRGAGRGIIGLGNIENRDSRYNPFSRKNLVDMLVFSLSNEGYVARRTDVLSIIEKRSGPARPVQTRTGDDTADLLPEHLRNVAGEQRPAARSASSGEISPEEVRTVAARDGLDFFVQGAMSRSESGNLLEKEENCLIFLDIYSKNGEKIAAISFSVIDGSLDDADLLRSVCARIAKAFGEKFPGSAR